MAIAKRSNAIYTAELALSKRVSVEQNFAQQSYIAFREIKFGISPCCVVNYESAVIKHSIYEWKYSKSDKTVASTEVKGIFVAPLAPINETASSVCPATPSNVCTIVELASLISTGGTYTQCFTTPLPVWNITHNLGKYPSVTVVDGDTVIVIGNVDYVNSNVVQITFDSAFSGCVFLN
tara:strand:+ start:167 stop:703 length:537 start_codon:yes stop_codon:yes gene_type:complete